MADRKLAANVVVGGVLYPAGSIPPTDVAEQITNPNAWGKQEADKAPAKPADSGGAPAKKATKAPAKKSSSTNN